MLIPGSWLCMSPRAKSPTWLKMNWRAIPVLPPDRYDVQLAGKLMQSASSQLVLTGKAACSKVSSRSVNMFFPVREVAN